MMLNRAVSSPHIRQQRSMPNMMRWVYLALLPALVVQSWLFGWGTLLQVVLACALCIGFEALWLVARQRNLTPLHDHSAIVTGCLIGLAVPPTLPLWMLAIGCLFAIIIAKQLYGGLGHNLFNPAMVAYVVLLISFPAAMTQWLPTQDQQLSQLSLLDTLQLIVSGLSSEGFSSAQMSLQIDGHSYATLLDNSKQQLRNGLTLSEIAAQQYTVFWQLPPTFLVNLAFLFGGAVLLYKGIIQWRIPLALILGLTLPALVLWGLDSDHYLSPLTHALSGATMLAAFFIATDPVSASTTPKGRWVYGLLIGVLIYVIRTFGGYPDAVAFAVLLANCAVPLIDQLTKPKRQQVS